MTYYKAILQESPTIDFKVEEISEDDAYAKTSSTYGYVNTGENRSSGQFAIRKTKKDAINAIKKDFLEKINKCEEELINLKLIYKNIFF